MVYVNALPKVVFLTISESGVLSLRFGFDSGVGVIVVDSNAELDASCCFNNSNFLFWIIKVVVDFAVIESLLSCMILDNTLLLLLLFDRCVCVYLMA